MQIPRSLRELVMTTKSSAFVDESAATKNRNRADRSVRPTQSNADPSLAARARDDNEVLCIRGRERRRHQESKAGGQECPPHTVKCGSLAPLVMTTKSCAFVGESGAATKNQKRADRSVRPTQSNADPSLAALRS